VLQPLRSSPSFPLEREPPVAVLVGLSDRRTNLAIARGLLDAQCSTVNRVRVGLETASRADRDRRS
jgi:hypothetical protein